MSRFALLLALAPAPAFASPSLLLTAPIADWSITVENVSGSSDANQRDLRMTSAQPVVEIEGQMFCGNEYLEYVEVGFGNVYTYWSQNGADVMDWFSWGWSPPYDLPSNRHDTNFSFDHQLDLDTSWVDNGLLIDFSSELNPVKVVEQRLADYVDNGDSIVDFLRTDDVFEEDVQVNVVGWCSKNDADGVEPDLVVQTITARIFYRGDRNIQEQPRVGTPGTIRAPGSGGFYLAW